MQRRSLVPWLCRGMQRVRLRLTSSRMLPRSSESVDSEQAVFRVEVTHNQGYVAEPRNQENSE